jgi:hypothetical protein
MQFTQDIDETEYTDCGEFEIDITTLPDSNK